MNRTKRHLLGRASLVTLIASSVAFTNAYAQSSDEIIVTARKKEETLLDAPLAITAFGKTELEAGGFVDIIDVSKATPGLFIEEFNQTAARVNSTPRFRGVFLATGNRLQQTATVFLDGIYMSGGIQTIGVNELERIEVIKGPQSALFGRNTFAGAINYVTKDPSEEFEATLDATVASRGEYRVSAGIEGPIANGLSYRLAGYYEDVDGHYTNNASGDANGTRLGDESQWNINGSLLFEPTSDFKLKLRGSYRELDDGVSAAINTTGVLQHNFGGFLIENGLANTNNGIAPAPNDGNVEVDGSRGESVFRGTIRPPSEDRIGLNSGFDVITAMRAAIQGDGRYNAATNALTTYDYNPFNVDSYGLKLDEMRFSADAEWNVTDNVQFNFLAGYAQEKRGNWSDFDQTRDFSFSAFAANEIEDFSLEGRLSGSLLDDKLLWKVGASYVDIQIEGNSATINNFGPTIIFGAAFENARNVTGAETLGFFGSLDYQLNDQFSVTLEGRYQEDKIQEDGVNAGLPEAISPTTLTNFLPRGTLRYQPSDSSTFYATYSEGNLPGGFNPEVGELTASQLAELEAIAPGTSIAFGEETLKNYELGWKQQIAGGQGGFNVAAFHMQRSDEIFRSLQTVTAVPGSPNAVRTVAFNANGATTDIYGIEIDAVYSVNDNLDLRGSFAYIDAKIDSYPDNTLAGDFTDIFGPGANVSGTTAPRFPPLTGSFGATWEQPMEMGMFDTWFTRGDVFYTGNYWDSNANVAEQDVAVDGNLRTGLRGDNLTLEVFVSNLFNEDAAAAAFNFADLSIANRTQAGGFFDFSREAATVALRDKRQFGVRAKYTFR